MKIKEQVSINHIDKAWPSVRVATTKESMRKLYAGVYHVPYNTLAVASVGSYKSVSYVYQLGQWT